MKLISLIVVLSFSISCSIKLEGTASVQLHDAGVVADAEVSDVVDATVDVVDEVGASDATIDVVSEPVDNSQHTAAGYCQWGYRCHSPQFTGLYGSSADCVNAVSANLRLNHLSCSDACGDGLAVVSCDLAASFPVECAGCCGNVLVCR